MPRWKSERIKRIPISVRQERIKNEARSLFRCHSAGVPVPTLFEADLHSRQLITAKIEGPTLKRLLSEAEIQDDSQKIEDLLKKVWVGKSQQDFVLILTEAQSLNSLSII